MAFSSRSRLTQLPPGKLGVGEALLQDGGHGVDKAASVAVLPVVEPEGLFVEVAEQVEWLDADVGAVDRPLQEAPEVFESVSVDVPLSVGLGVVDDLVNVVALQATVRRKIIGEHFRAGFDVFADSGLKLMPATGAYYAGPDFGPIGAVPFQEAQDGDLAHSTGALDGPLTFRPVHVAGLAADEGFIDFDLTVDLVERLGLHGEPDTVEHEPRGFLSDANRTAQFVARNTVSAIHQHPHRREPLGQTDRRVLEDGPHLDRELLLATTALPDAPGFQVVWFGGFATGTDRPARPPDIGDERHGYIGVGEVANGFEQGSGSIFQGGHRRTHLSGVSLFVYPQYTTDGPVSQVYYYPWKIIERWPNYEVSDDGRVRRVARTEEPE